MKKINLRKVAETILKKQPYRIITEKEDLLAKWEDYKNIPATEKTKEYEDCRHEEIGENFEKFPFSTEKSQSGYYRQHLDFIDENGEAIDSCKCLEYIAFTNYDKTSKAKKEWRLKADSETLVFAIVSTLESNEKTHETRSGILFLSRPYTIKEIGELRANHFGGIDKTRISNSLDKIELIWGK